MKNVRRRYMHAVIIGILFIFYYLATDPDLGLISNLSFGADLMLALQMVIISVTGGILIELFQSLWFDGNTDESNIIEIAKTTSKGAGSIYIGNSIRILAYAIIVAGSVVAIIR